MRLIPAADLGFLLFVVLANVVLATLALDAMTVFTPLRLAILTGTVAVLILRCFKIEGVSRDTRLSWWLFGALASGLFLAGHLAPHYQGGQDQGYYTAMAEMFARGQPVSFLDAYRQTLPNDLRTVYDAMKVWSVEQFPDGRQALQFYTLHPGLMAIATQLFGSGYHTVAMLVAFAVCIVSLYLITYELTNGSQRLAAFAAWLVAINPAYVFFAKYPVTEITAGAFVSLSLYFLLIGYRATSPSRAALYWIAALLAMNAFCFTRMSFPEIAPFLVALSAILFVIEDRRKFFVLLFVVASFGCYGLSLIYYHAVMPELFWGIVTQVYVPALRRGQWLIAAGAIACAVVLGLVAWRPTRAKAISLIRRAVTIGCEPALRFPGFILLLIALPSMVLLVRTGHFPFFGSTQPPGIHMARFHAAYVLMLFASPFLFLLLLAGTRSPGPDRAALLLPSLLLLCVWPVYMTFASSVPQLYYFGRYLLPEVLPATILVAVIALRLTLLPRAAAVGLAGLAIVYSAAFSIVQIRHAEGETGQPFHEISKKLINADVVVVDGAQFAEGYRSRLVVPLRYALGLNTFILPSGGLDTRLNIFRRVQSAAWGRSYLLTQERAPDLREWLDLGFEKVAWVRYGSDNLLASADPTTISTWTLPLRTSQGVLSPLVLLAPPKALAASSLDETIRTSAAGQGREILREGWSDPEQDYTWTNGPSARLLFEVPNPRVSERGLRLTLHGSTFEDQRVAFSAGGTSLGSRRLSFKLESVVLDIPQAAIRDNQLEVTIDLPDAHSPASVGQGTDPRQLGLALMWARLDSN